MEKINIGKNREVFWDNYLIDTERTTAFHRVMEPTKKESVFAFDKGFELLSISYPHLVKVGDTHRLYYITSNGREDAPQGYLAVIESTDGFNWHKPHLNIFDMPELTENNIVLPVIDNAFVFTDTNPSCPENEKFKAVVKVVDHDAKEPEMIEMLWCYTSPDGYHFTKSHMMTNKGHFDSLNTAHWNGEKYLAFIRSFHNIIPGGEISDATRDVRVMYSDDIKTWTTPELIEFNDDLDYPLYTNNVIPCERAPQILMGFPTRYEEKRTWEGTTQQLPSFPRKKAASEKFNLDRVGRVVTDGIFMCSRDGKSWYRYNEPFFANGYESIENWVYGDAYPCYGFIDSGFETYYMYRIDGKLGSEPKRLSRYEITKDRFACIMADSVEKVLVTNPIIFDGKELHLNFSGTAFGYMYLDVLDENGNPLSGESYEIYGDTIDRTVIFPDGSDFSKFAGTPVRLRFRMMNTKLFSLKFE